MHQTYAKSNGAFWFVCFTETAGELSHALTCTKRMLEVRPYSRYVYIYDPSSVPRAYGCIAVASDSSAAVLTY